MYSDSNPDHDVRLSYFMFLCISMLNMCILIILKIRDNSYLINLKRCSFYKRDPKKYFVDYGPSEKLKNR